MTTIEERLATELQGQARLADGARPDRADVERRSGLVRRRRQRRRVVASAVAAVVAVAGVAVLLRDDRRDTEVVNEPPAYGFVVESPEWTLDGVSDEAPEPDEADEVRPWGVSVRAADGGFGVKSALVVWPSQSEPGEPTTNLGGRPVTLERSGSDAIVYWEDAGGLVMVQAVGLDDTQLAAIIGATQVTAASEPPTVDLPAGSALTAAPAGRFGISNRRVAQYSRADGSRLTVTTVDDSLGLEIDAFEGGASTFALVTLAHGRAATVWGDPGVRRLTIEGDVSVELASEGVSDDDLLALATALVPVDQAGWARLAATPASPARRLDGTLHWGECGDGAIGVVYASGACSTVDSAAPDGYLSGYADASTNVRLFKVSSDVIARTAVATLDAEPLTVTVVAGDGPGFAVFAVEVPADAAGTITFTAVTVVNGVETPVTFTTSV